MWIIFKAILGHPLALAIASAFAGLQAWTWIRLWHSLGRQIAVAGSLSSNNVADDAAPDESGWFRWIARHFPLDGASVLSRDDALKELDRRLADKPDYARLQRLAVGAPLIGVLITAFGFLNPPAVSQTEKLSEIFTAVTPLILGVAYGALLALLNQVLLYLCERRIDDVRSRARDWFDESIWLDHAGRDDEKHLADSMRNLAGELGHQFRAIESATNVLVQSAGTLQRCLAAFSSQVEPLPSSLALFKSASDAATATFERLAPAGTQLGEHFTQAVSRFKDTVDAGFSSAAKQQDDASGRLLQTATRAHEVILKMEHAAAAIEANSQSQKETAGEFHRSVIDAIIPHQELALEALRRIDSLASGLSTTMEAFNESFTQFTARSAGLFAAADSGIQQLAAAAGNLQGAVETQLEPAARLHHSVLTGIASTTDRTQQSAEKLQDACALLESAASEQATAGRELTKSVNASLTPAHVLLGRAATNFDKTAEELAEHVDRLRSSLAGAATNLSTLLPLARQAFSEMPNAVNDFRTVVNRHFEPAAQRHAEVVGKIGGGVDDFNDLVAELRGATAELSQIVGRQAAATDAFRPACDAVRAAAGELGQVAHSLRGTVTGDMLPAQKELHIATDSLGRSVELFATFIDKGIVPATQRLQELDTTIASLQTLVNDIRPLSAMSQDASKLLEGISKAAEVAVALNRLPQQIAAGLAPQLGALTLAVSDLDKRLQAIPTAGKNGKSLFGRFLGR